MLGERLLRIGVPLAVTAVALQTVSHLSNEFLFDDRIQGLDADVEGNVFTWSSSVSAFAVAVAAFLHAMAFPTVRRHFGVLAGLGVLFSLDDAIQLHERVALEVGEDLLGLPDYVAVRLWLVFYLPLLLLAGVLLWIVSERVWEPAGKMLRVGLLLLVASIPAEVAGVLTRWLEEHGTGAPEDLRVAVEEGLELGGWILAAVALTAAVTVELIRYRPVSAPR